MKKIFSIIAAFSFFNSAAQEVDSVLLNAKWLAESGDYIAADSVLDIGLAYLPHDHDMLCLKARILSWYGKYEQANTVINKVLDSFPVDQEGLRIKAKLFYWQGFSNQLLILAQEALVSYPNDPEFGYFEAFAYYHIGMPDKSLQLIDELLTREPFYQNAIQLKRDILSKYHTYVQLDLSLTGFDKLLNPWHEIRVGYRSHKSNSWNAHLVCADRFESRGLNFEAEYYPRIAKKTYAAITVSYSPSFFFPTYTIGARLNQGIGNFEIAGGVRKVEFTNRPFYMYEASVGYYLPNYWISYKLFLPAVAGIISPSHLCRISRYLNAEKTMISIEILSGSSIIEFAGVQDTIMILNKSGIAINIEQAISDHFIISSKAGYAVEEYLENTNRRRIDFQLSIKKILR